MGTAIRPARPFVVFLVALTLLAIGACRKQSRTTSTDKPSATPSAEASPKAPSAESIDACALVTKQDAEQLARTPLNDATPGRSSCTYTGPTSGPTAQVEVFVGDGAKKQLEIDKDKLNHEFRTLSGIGDEAWAEDNYVFIRKGTVWVSLRLVRLNDPKENDKPLEDLARIVATRF